MQTYNDISNSQEHLEHYGVLGMRWGVRRNPERAYQKASKKLRKYGSKVDSSRKKAAKYYEKADRKSYSFFSTKRGVQKAFVKASKAQRKVNRLVYKGSKWYQEMEKAFSKQSIVSISEEDKELGKTLVNDLIDTSKSRYEMRYSDRYIDYDDGRRR